MENKIAIGASLVDGGDIVESDFLKANKNVLVMRVVKFPTEYSNATIEELIPQLIGKDGNFLNQMEKMSKCKSISIKRKEDGLPEFIVSGTSVAQVDRAEKIVLQCISDKVKYLELRKKSVARKQVSYKRKRGNSMVKSNAARFTSSDRDRIAAHAKNAHTCVKDLNPECTWKSSMKCALGNTNKDRLKMDNSEWEAENNRVKKVRHNSRWSDKVHRFDVVPEIGRLADTIKSEVSKKYGTQKCFVDLERGHIFEKQFYGHVKVPKWPYLPRVRSFAEHVQGDDNKMASEVYDVDSEEEQINTVVYDRFDDSRHDLESSDSPLPVIEQEFKEQLSKPIPSKELEWLASDSIGSTRRNENDASNHEVVLAGMDQAESTSKQFWNSILRNEAVDSPSASISSNNRHDDYAMHDKRKQAEIYQAESSRQDELAEQETHQIEFGSCQANGDTSLATVKDNQNDIVKVTQQGSFAENEIAEFVENCIFLDEDDFQKSTSSDPYSLGNLTFKSVRSNSNEDTTVECEKEPTWKEKDNDARMEYYYTSSTLDRTCPTSDNSEVQRGVHFQGSSARTVNNDGFAHALSDKIGIAESRPKKTNATGGHDFDQTTNDTTTNQINDDLDANKNDSECENRSEASSTRSYDHFNMESDVARRLKDNSNDEDFEFDPQEKDVSDSIDRQDVSQDGTTLINKASAKANYSNASLEDDISVEITSNASRLEHRKEAFEKVVHNMPNSLPIRPGGSLDCSLRDLLVPDSNRSPSVLAVTDNMNISDQIIHRSTNIKQIKETRAPARPMFYHQNDFLPQSTVENAPPYIDNVVSSQRSQDVTSVDQSTIGMKSAQVPTTLASYVPMNGMFSSNDNSSEKSAPLVALSKVHDGTDLEMAISIDSDSASSKSVVEEDDLWDLESDTIESTSEAENEVAVETKCDTPESDTSQSDENAPSDDIIQNDDNASESYLDEDSGCWDLESISDPDEDEVQTTESEQPDVVQTPILNLPLKKSSAPVLSKVRKDADLPSNNICNTKNAGIQKIAAEQTFAPCVRVNPSVSSSIPNPIVSQEKGTVPVEFDTKHCIPSTTKIFHMAHNAPNKCVISPFITKKVDIPNPCRDSSPITNPSGNILQNKSGPDATKEIKSKSLKSKLNGIERLLNPEKSSNISISKDTSKAKWNKPESSDSKNATNLSPDAATISSKTKVDAPQKVPDSKIAIRISECEHSAKKLCIVVDSLEATRLLGRTLYAFMCRVSVNEKLLVHWDWCNGHYVFAKTSFNVVYDALRSDHKFCIQCDELVTSDYFPVPKPTHRSTFKPFNPPASCKFNCTCKTCNDLRLHTARRSLNRITTSISLSLGCTVPQKAANHDNATCDRLVECKRFKHCPKHCNCDAVPRSKVNITFIDPSSIKIPQAKPKRKKPTTRFKIVDETIKEQEEQYKRDQNELIKRAHNKYQGFNKLSSIQPHRVVQLWKANQLPHVILHLSPSATLRDAKIRYHKLALQWHPDKSSGKELAFLAIKEAYAALMRLA